jgi:hypothetical protein
MIGWAQCGLHKKRVGTHYTKFVFLYLVGLVGHVVHSRALGARSFDALFFIFRWAWCIFHKNHNARHYAKLVFLHSVGYAGHTVHSGASGPQIIDAQFFMLGWDLCRFHKKVCWEMLCQTCVFPFYGICGSHSAFSCVRGAKCGRTIFQARIGPVRFP